LLLRVYGMHGKSRAETGFSPYSLITTDANELASDVIERMPVILHPKEYDRWLERESDRPPLDLLRPFDSEAMMKWACNPLVGSVKNNGPEMLNSG
jgi:putative SOS response-associated peptidase YedK